MTKYKVLKDFTVKAAKGEQGFLKGQLIELTPEKAEILINNGKVKPLNDENIIPDSIAIKMFSKKPGKELWLVKDKKMENQLIAEGVEIPIFNEADIKAIPNDLRNETLQAIYDVKKVFQGSKITSVERIGNKNEN